MMMLVDLSMWIWQEVIQLVTVVAANNDSCMYDSCMYVVTLSEGAQTSIAFSQ